MAKNKKQKRKVALKAKRAKQQRYGAIQSSVRIDAKKMMIDFPDKQKRLKYIDSLITLFGV